MNRRGFLATPAVVAIAGEVPETDPRAAMVEFIKRRIEEYFEHCSRPLVTRVEVLVPGMIGHAVLSMRLGEELVELQGIPADQLEIES